MAEKENVFQKSEYLMVGWQDYINSIFHSMEMINAKCSCGNRLIAF